MKKHLLIAPIILGFAATGVTESNLSESLKASEEKEKSEFLDYGTMLLAGDVEALSDSTSEADMQFSVNNGTSPQLFPPSGVADYDIFSFGSGPFLVNIAVQ